MKTIFIVDIKRSMWKQEDMFSRRQLISKVVEKFGGDVITLLSPGY